MFLTFSACHFADLFLVFLYLSLNYGGKCLIAVILDATVVLFEH